MAGMDLKRVLVLEDDDGIRVSLRLALEDAGYAVAESASAEDALVTVSAQHVDIMMVDLMLGGIDGFTFIKRVRSDNDAPIVVISARDSTKDIVAALEAGADDYVTKPFVVEQVLARLTALLRRPAMAADPAEAESERLVISGAQPALSVDLAAAVVVRDGEPIHLTKTEYRLLEALVANPGRVMSRRVLLEQVWDHGFFGDERLVDVHVRRLRSKIEVDPGRPQLLVTVRGLGYRLDTR
jgi:DNA-binding response OmpR family regulator